MRTILAVIALTLIVSPDAWSQLGPARQRPRPAPRIEDVVAGFYVSEFQKRIEISDEQFVKILPMIRQTLQERREIAARRIAGRRELGALLQSGGPEEEIKRTIREIDGADADFYTHQERFLKAADPLLTIRQQARARIFLFSIEQDVARMLNRVRQQNRRPNPPR